MEFEDAETCSALLSCLDSLLSEAHLISREKGLSRRMNVPNLSQCVLNAAQIVSADYFLL